MAQSVGQPVVFGPLFSGNTGPALELIFLWDSGGLVNLSHAYVEATIRRWDPRRKTPLGPVVTAGPLGIVDSMGGIARFEWIIASPVASVPIDTGWYMIQADVTFQDGTGQQSQRGVFEVLPS